ncbi:MAG TPA: ATP-binding protein [Chloroflexota bacterium]|nr:ATP-binding protein [Chloroflexota bacterium]
MAVSSLRGRLAIWYATLLAIILAITSFLSYSFHSVYHYEEVDRALVGTAIHVLGKLRPDASTGGGGIVLPPIEEFDSPDIFVRVYAADGQIIAQSANSGHQALSSPQQVAASPRGVDSGGSISWLLHPLVSLGRPALAAEGGFLTTSGTDGRGRVRLYAVPISNGSTVYSYLEAGVSLDSLDHSMERLRLLLATMSVVGLLAALGGGWAIAGSALRPMATMTTTARAIALSRGFSRRLPHLGRRDELGQLADTFNEMLASLEEAYQAQQRFIADASHELRAPLTAIQGNLELLERAPQMDESERAETLSYLRQEAGRMGRLVADLLVLARADAGQPIRHQTVELDRVLLDVFQETRVLARGRKMAIVDLDQVQVLGDPDRLKQLLLILVDNAIKYTPEGGRVQLAIRTEPGAAVITVADTGIGIGPEDIPHLFERFYRADKARSRDLGGTGLGLSIAKWIADSHGGHISVESTVGQGSTFTIRLPLAHASREP